MIKKIQRITEIINKVHKEEIKESNNNNKKKKKKKVQGRKKRKKKVPMNE